MKIKKERGSGREEEGRYIRSRRMEDIRKESNEMREGRT